MNILSTEEVLSKLQEKKPLSLVRYGDGEAIVLNGFNDVDSLSAVFRRQFGYTPQIDQAQQIRQNLIETYQQCDILGIPTHERLKNDKNNYWVRAEKILRECVDNNILEIKQLCSIDVHSHLLDKNYYHEILSSVESLNYISCRDLDEQFKNRYPNLKRVNKFILAPEVKFTTNTTGEKHYPDQFNKVPKWMDKAISCENSLCLVGAGIAGKIYCNWFRDRGGVSMDIGSIFDSWAGYATRGPGRGHNAVDNTYKL